MMNPDNIDKIVFPKEDISLEIEELPVFTIEDRTKMDFVVQISSEASVIIHSIDISRIDAKRGGSSKSYKLEEIKRFLKLLDVKFPNAITKADAVEMLKLALHQHGITKE